MAGWGTFYLSDRQGSVIGVVDQQGRPVLRARYDAFGTRAAVEYGTAPAPGSYQNYYEPYGYVGRRKDPYTQLQVAGSRWYDPQLGRWLTQDPNGSGYGGDPNGYRYARDNPANSDGAFTPDVTVANTPSFWLLDVPLWGLQKIGLRGSWADAVATRAAAFGRGIDPGRNFMNATADAVVATEQAWNSSPNMAQGATIAAFEWLTHQPLIAPLRGMVTDFNAELGRGSGLGNVLYAGARAFGRNQIGPAGVWRITEGFAGQEFGGINDGRRLGVQEAWERIGGGVGELAAVVGMAGDLVAVRGASRARLGARLARAEADVLAARAEALSEERLPTRLRSLDVVGDAAREGEAMIGCFAAGTPFLAPGGSKLVEQLRKGDMVLSRSEFSPRGSVEAKAVERVFVRLARILELGVGSLVIRTSSEHPFYVLGSGWTPASRLRVGDRLLGHDGRAVAVEALNDTGRHERVYNVRVQDYHTYFVGAEDWGFSVWAHNAGCGPELAGEALAKDAEYQALKQQLRSQARQAAWAGDMEQVNGTMARLARRALREGGGDWQQAEAALARYAEAMNNRFERVGSSKRAVVDATVENGSGLRNGGYGTRAEPWNADGSPRAGTSRIELGIESTALPGNPVVSAVDISYSYTKPFQWAKYTDGFGSNVPIADVRMSRNLRNLSDPILNYVEWRRGGVVTSRQDFGNQGLPAGW